MQGPGQRRRAALQLPRVDFDLSGLALGTIGYLLLMVLWRGLASALGGSGRGHADSSVLQQRFVTEFTEQLGNLPFLRQILQEFGFGNPDVNPMSGAAVQVGEGLHVWQYVLITVLLVIVWSIVSGSLARVHAVRIARDETVGPDDALGFVFKNLRAFLFAPLFIVGAAAFFVAVTAACGALSAVPWAGGVLQIVAHPVALLASLVVMVIALGGIFGVPLLHAALATERNGMLDAVSRTYSYAFSRPVTFVAGVGVVAVVSGIIWKLGHWFIDYVWLQAFTLGASWNDTAAVALQEGFAAGRTLSWPDSSVVEGGAVLNVWVAWLMTALAMSLVRGFMISYAVGGLTDLYFLLRREVDGTDESQVYASDEPVPVLLDPDETG